jgi:hypothetical protein
MFDPLINGMTYGSHATLLIDNSGEPVLCGPAGDYSRAHKCPSDACLDSDADVGKYKKYQQKLGSTVQSFVFDTTSEEEKQIFDRIYQIGTATGGFCAINATARYRSEFGHG